eukprot:GHVS01095178.1.p1 GENE.GHVS01095178.1~~GHVS01095178.1.p1  ORF type:complete len:110 (-),score=7.13 GHVS01095178.1:240-569(-)
MLLSVMLHRYAVGFTEAALWYGGRRVVWWTIRYYEMAKGSGGDVKCGMCALRSRLPDAAVEVSNVEVTNIEVQEDRCNRRKQSRRYCNPEHCVGESLLSGWCRISVLCL